MTANTKIKKIRFSEGWYPVDLKYNEDQPIVYFAKKQGARFSKAFFKEEFHGAQEQTSMPLDSLSIDLDSRKIRPIHMVFHTSRCGSTLLTRMLNEIPDLRVFSEPLALNELLSSPVAVSPELFASRLRKIIYLLDLATPAEYSELLVKWGSWSVLCWESIVSIVPPASMMFIWRDPVEVAVSILEKPPLWLQKNALAKIFERYAVDLMPDHPGADAESTVRIVAAMLKAGKAMPEGTLKVNYKSLPEYVFTHLCPHIGRVPGAEIAAKMREVAKYSSKSNEQQLFSDDSGRKQLRAPNDVKYFAQRILSDNLLKQ